jgi:hypothetical protein
LNPTSANSNAPNKDDNPKKYMEARNVPKANHIQLSQSPNYTQLNHTPWSQTRTAISAAIQFGEPYIDKSPATHMPPLRDGNRRKFPVKQRPLSTDLQIKKPLTIKQTELKTQLGRSKTERDLATQQQPLRNLFDHPMTARELHQLKLAQLVKGHDQNQVQQLFALLLDQSKRISNLLIPDNMQPKDDKQQALSSVKTEVQTTLPSPTLKDIVQEKLSIAQADLLFLHDEYPKKSQQEQHDSLKQLRLKYNVPTKSNPIHIQKSIRDTIQQLSIELQAL